MMTERDAMCMQIKELEFALAELNLFLDSHPYNEKALSYFKELSAKHDALVFSLEEKGMPLTARGNRGDKWDWVMTPWPWELCKN